jgi:heme/copper-type cytochrome/quinol oxidase subunit 2
MATTLYHPSLLLSSTSHILNQTLIDDTNLNNDHLLHLFLLTTIWIVLIITIVFGTTGNILVLYVYVNRNDNKTCTFFIKILAIVDLLICLLLAPLELYQTTTGKD